VFRPELRFASLVGVALVIVTVLAAPIGGAATFQADDPGPPDDAGPPDGEGPPDDAGPPDDDDDDENDGAADDDDRDDDVGEDDEEETDGDDDEEETDGDDDEEETDGDEDDEEEQEGGENDDEEEGNGQREGGDDEAGGTDDGSGTDGADSSDDTADSTTPSVVADHPDAPSIGVVDVDADESAVEAGDPVEIDVTLVNRGESDRTVPVRLRLFGEVANRAETTVPAGETHTVTFVHEVVQPGAYEPSAYGASDEFVVEPADDGDGGNDSSEDDSLDGFGAPVAVATLVGVAALRRRAS